MRRQCMRLFCNFNFRYTVPMFHFSQVSLNNAQKFISQCLNEAKISGLSEQQLQERIGSVKPVINQMDINELQDLVNFTFSIELEDEGYASKVFDRATELFIQKKSTMHQTLTVLSKLINQKYTKLHYEQQYSFLIAATQAPVLEASEISLAMFIYGQLQNHLMDRDLDIERALIIHFKSKIDEFNSRDLKNFSYGVMLAQIKNGELFELLERKTLQVPLQYSDFIRIATAVGIFGTGSDQFWKVFEETGMKEIPNTSPNDLATLLMFYKQCGHGNKNLYRLISENFVQNYKQFTYFQKLQMFSGFARVQYPSSDVFKLFLRDIKKVIDHSGIIGVQVLIYDCLSILPGLPEATQKIFFDFILNHSAEMNITLKKKIFESFKRSNIMTPELEVALAPMQR